MEENEVSSFENGLNYDNLRKPILVFFKEMQQVNKDVAKEETKVITDFLMKENFIYGCFTIPFMGNYSVYIESKDKQRLLDLLKEFKEIKEKLVL